MLAACVYLISYGIFVMAGARTTIRDFFGKDQDVHDIKIYYIYLAKPMLDDSLNALYWPLNTLSRVVNTRKLPADDPIYRCIDLAKRTCGVEHPAYVEMSEYSHSIIPGDEEAAEEKVIQYEGFITVDKRWMKWYMYKITYQGECTIVETHN